MRIFVELDEDDNVMSQRGEDWMAFAKTVLNHIEKYTVPQYGDKGDDLITGYTAEKCVECVEKYAKRFGANQREGQELLDMMKIAHYAQCAYDKIGEGARVGEDEEWTGRAFDVLTDIADYFDDAEKLKKQVKITVEFL